MCSTDARAAEFGELVRLRPRTRRASHSTLSRPQTRCNTILTHHPQLTGPHRHSRSAVSEVVERWTATKRLNPERSIFEASPKTSGTWRRPIYDTISAAGISSWRWLPGSSGLPAVFSSRLTPMRSSAPVNASSPSRFARRGPKLVTVPALAASEAAPDLLVTPSKQKTGRDDC